MCMEDIRVMRDTGSNVRIVTLTGGDDVVAAADLHRVMIQVAVFSGGGGTFAPDPLVPSAGGYQLDGTNIPLLEWFIERHGRMVTLPWRCKGAAGDKIVVAETTLNRD